MTEQNRRFTPDEIETARTVDLPSLLESLGYSVIRVGSYYSVKEMDSLRIKNRRTWFRYSEQVGGDAITFLEHFHGKSFTEAVEYLLGFTRPSGYRPVPFPDIKPARSAFMLPPANENNKRVFAYLRKRGIDAQVIREFLDKGWLYEEAEHHNCVFIGRTSEGKAAFANMRGTCDLNGMTFKGGVSGSDKNVGFRLPCREDSDTVRVYEAPIDLMSHLTLSGGSASNALALCCLYDGPLERYLSDNPHLKNILFCLDNDRWGQEAAEKMASKYCELGYATDILKPPSCKDWNDYLQLKNAKAKRREMER